MGAPAFERLDVVVVRRRWSALFTVLSAASALLVQFVWHHARSLDGMVAIVSAFYAALLGVIFFANRSPSRAHGPLAVGSTYVYFKKRPLVARDAIRAAHIVPRGGDRNVVRIQHGRFVRSLELTLAGEADARELLRTLGVDATQTVARFWFASRLVTSRLVGAFWIAAYIVLLLFTIRVVVAARLDELILPLVMVFGAIPLAWPTRLTIGTDGVLVSWLTGTEHVPYSSITAAHGFHHGVELELRSGRRIRLMLPSRRSSGQVDVEHRDLIVERIREGAEAYEGGGAAIDEASLVRGGRDTRGWIRSLRALGSGGSADHRTAPVSRDELWRVVEDPSAQPSARAGAAIALSSALSAEERPRLRTVANATASREVRVLLEAAAKGDDDEALEQAAEALEAGE